MSGEEWHIVWFTAWVSALSTVLILPFGLGAAWLLARHFWPGKSLVETFVCLPLVMPPVATGLLLLKILGRHGFIGGPLHDYLNFDVAFTWLAVLVALAVMSFPLLVLSTRAAFDEVNPRLEQIARTLGAGNFRVFCAVTLPLARRGVLAGMILAFARALGEFGATIMVAGYLPGKFPHSPSPFINPCNWATTPTPFASWASPRSWPSSRSGAAPGCCEGASVDMTLLARNISLPLAEFHLQAEFEARGRITVLFGPSGAGKTTLLDLVAGLRRPQSAFLQLDDTILADTSQNICVPARRRGVGYVPQDLALFPHLSVRRNLLFGHRPGSDPRFGLDRVADLLEIQPLLARGVNELSGGEKQRVALARALLASPRLLLLDEPLASLDLPLKARILPFLTRIRDEFRVPMLYVTHDRYETVSLGDEMIVLVNGRVAQTGTVAEVFSRPANLAVAGIVAVETVNRDAS